MTTQLWEQVGQLIVWYENNGSISRHLAKLPIAISGPLQKLSIIKRPWRLIDRCTVVDTYVIVIRPAILLWLVWWVYPWSWRGLVAIPVALYTLLDATTVVTAHAFFPQRPLKSTPRYVVLNLIVFLTLVPWFAILLSTVEDQFVDDQLNPLPLTWRGALRTAWAAVTASAVIEGHKANGFGVYFVLAAATAWSVYFVIVILVMVVARATPPAKQQG